MMYGLDIGGTKIELAIFDNAPGAQSDWNLKQQDSWRLPTPGQEYRQFIDSIVEMVEEADRKTGMKGSVGVGLPGFLDSNGCAVSANIPCINGEPVAAVLSERLGRHVGFENDVNAFVYSEAHGGAASGAKHALGIVLGTGVAGGLCIEGELYYGRQKVAIECGHISMPAVVRERYHLPVLQCGCGAFGCVEQYLSGPGLLRMCGFFGTQYASVAALVEAVRKQDATAVKIFDAYMQCLGCYFSQLVLLYDPDVMVLGGGLSNVPEIYQQIEVAMKAHLIESVFAPDVLPPKFGDSSGVRGAALMGRTLPPGQSAMQKGSGTL